MNEFGMLRRCAESSQFACKQEENISHSYTPLSPHALPPNMWSLASTLCRALLSREVHFLYVKAVQPRLCYARLLAHAVDNKTVLIPSLAISGDAALSHDALKAEVEAASEEAAADIFGSHVLSQAYLVSDSRGDCTPLYSWAWGPCSAASCLHRRRCLQLAPAHPGCCWWAR